MQECTRAGKLTFASPSQPTSRMSTANCPAKCWDANSRLMRFGCTCSMLAKPSMRAMLWWQTMPCFAVCHLDIAVSSPPASLVKPILCIPVILCMYSMVIQMIAPRCCANTGISTSGRMNSYVKSYVASLLCCTTLVDMLQRRAPTHPHTNTHTHTHVCLVYIYIYAEKCYECRIIRSKNNSIMSLNINCTCANPLP